MKVCVSTRSQLHAHTVRISGPTVTASSVSWLKIPGAAGPVPLGSVLTSIVRSEEDEDGEDDYEEEEEEVEDEEEEKKKETNKKEEEG